jgi:hypothetical protein
MASMSYRPLALSALTESHTTKDYTGHTTALYLLFLDFAGTGGPLRFLEDDASFAARCACLKRSILTLLWALWSTMGRGYVFPNVTPAFVRSLFGQSHGAYL